MLLIPIIFTCFKVLEKIGEKKMVNKIDHFFVLANFELQFKNTKNTVNG